MKQRLLLVAILIASCASGAMAAKPKNADSIWIENKQAAFKQGVVDIDMSLPQLDSESGSEALMRNANKAIIATLTQDPPVPYSAPVTTLSDIRLFVATMASDLTRLGKAGSIDPIPYQCFSSWSAFGNEVVLSIFVKRYIYSGGAHGNTVATYLNFNSQTGEQLHLRRLIKDTTKLMDLAAEYFCKERRLPAEAMQIATGLFCELAALPMPSQMGFNAKGFVLYYNTYEIAPYSMGPIIITIPYKDKTLAAVIGDNFSGSKMVSAGMHEFDSNTKRVNTTVKYR